MRAVFTKAVVAFALMGAVVVGSAAQASAKPILRWEKIGVPVVDEVGRTTVQYVNARIDRLPSSAR
jgi:hypothetical protein